MAHFYDIFNMLWHKTIMSSTQEIKYHLICLIDDKVDLIRDSSV